MCICIRYDPRPALLINFGKITGSQCPTLNTYVSNIPMKSTKNNPQNYHLWQWVLRWWWEESRSSLPAQKFSASLINWLTRFILGSINNRGGPASLCLFIPHSSWNPHHPPHLHPKLFLGSLSDSVRPTADQTNLVHAILWTMTNLACIG